MNEPTEEQLLDALRQIKTEDVVVQTVATLVNLLQRSGSYFDVMTQTPVQSAGGSSASTRHRSM